MINQKIIAIPFFLAAISLLTVGCALDRSDPRAVAEASFRAIMTKDYQQLRQLVGPTGNIPTEEEWSDASFIRDATPGEGVKAQWAKGPIGGFTVGDLVLEDPQGPVYRAEKLAQVGFVLSGKDYVATFPIAHVGDQWSPGTNPFSSDFLVRFETDKVQNP